MSEKRSRNQDDKIVYLNTRKFLRRTKWEYCVICGQRTDTRRDEPISKRPYYVDGVGELCPRCFRETLS